MATRTILLKNVRIGLSNLDSAKVYKNTQPRFSATFYIPKDGDEDETLWGAINEAAEEMWPGKGAKKVKEFEKSKMQFCVKDGDELDFEPAHGHWVLTGHRYEKHGPPAQRDRKNNIAKAGLIYDGCYVNAAVDIWTQGGENPGVRCGLTGVQFVKDGDAFGGARRADGSAFESLDVDDEDI